jgi:hypothetical protein
MKVLLIHGLSRTPVSLAGLGWQLNRQGWPTEHFGYAAFIESFDQIVGRLRHTIQQLSTGSYSVVAHSLGGLLTRAALGDASISQPAHVLMLGTPNQQPRLAPLAWRLPPFQWCTGQCGKNLATTHFFESLPGLRSPYTVIAGVGGPTGWLSPFGHEPNDGIVAVSETQLSKSDRRIEFPVEHTFMMHDAAVQASVVDILQQHA